MLALPDHAPDLEIQFKSKLNYARSGRGTGDLSEIAERDVVYGVCIIYPVEDIEHFDASFTAKTFGEREQFDDRKIDVFLSRSGERVARRIAERRVRIEGRIVHNADACAVETRTRCYKCAGRENIRSNDLRHRRSCKYFR